MNRELNRWDYPQKIKYWGPDIDYVMFIDENGSNGKLIDIYRKLTNNIKISIDEKYFTITGCIFDRSNYSVMRKDIRNLKKQILE